MEIEASWQDKFSSGDLSGAITFLDTLDWNLSYNKSSHLWLLLSGDQLIISTKPKKGIGSIHPRDGAKFGSPAG